MNAFPLKKSDMLRRYWRDLLTFIWTPFLYILFFKSTKDFRICICRLKASNEAWIQQMLVKLLQPFQKTAFVKNLLDQKINKKKNFRNGSTNPRITKDLTIIIKYLEFVVNCMMMRAYQQMPIPSDWERSCNFSILGSARSDVVKNHELCFAKSSVYNIIQPSFSTSEK